MKNYLRRGAFENLCIHLGEYYKDLANTAYHCAYGLGSFPTQTLDEFFTEDEEEPVIQIAIGFFREFLTHRRKSSFDLDIPISVNAAIECKLLSVLFEEIFEVCDTLEKEGIEPFNGLNYVTCLIRLGTTVETDLNKAFPELNLKKAKAKLSRDGKASAQYKTRNKEERVRLFCEEFERTVTVDKKNVARMSRDRYEKMLKKYSHDKRGAPVGSTRQDFRNAAKAFLKEKYGKEITITITKS
jgi:hypothetical protein